MKVQGKSSEMSGTGTGSPEVREPAQRRDVRRISEIFRAGNIRKPNGTVSVPGRKENDMKEGLLSIGEMARLNHITIATLRLYDREGLLKPAFVDPDSGYRYYDICQNARLDMIAYMKELGMRLQEIQTVLSTEDITRIEAILAEKYEQIHKAIRALEIRRNAVERAIRAMERYRKSPVKGTISLEYNDRRYLWSIPAQNNFPFYPNLRIQRLHFLHTQVKVSLEYEHSGAAPNTTNDQNTRKDGRIFQMYTDVLRIPESAVFLLEIPCCMYSEVQKNSLPACRLTFRCLRFL